MHPVRSITTALLCLALTVYASGDDSATFASSGSGMVDLTISESVETHGRRADITRICRADYGVKGCTDFPVERLQCDCTLHGESWMIDARADVRAVIHLSENFANERVLIHERMHLEDLESSLREHLGRITSRQYQSEAACRTYAKVLTESPHLRVVMNEIRVKSNEKYGCARNGAY